MLFFRYSREEKFQMDFGFVLQKEVSGKYIE